MTALDDYERVEIRSRAALRAWLERHHSRDRGVWLVTFKKGMGPHVPYGTLVEELLCFGWVDSRPRKLDAERSLLLATPRKPTSAWSKANKDRVAALIAAGRMSPRGLEVVREAKKSGRWAALDAVEALETPPDLARALTAVPRAREHFEAFPRSAKRGILEWIAQAKRPETRARRVEETARLAGRNERANQWPRR